MDKVNNGLIHFTIVASDVNSTETKAFYEKVKQIYFPGKIVKLEKPGHYPDMNETVLYICNDNVCSQPIKNNELFNIDVILFLKKLNYHVVISNQ